MALKKWVDIEVLVETVNFNEFEEWCDSHRLRYDHQPWWGDKLNARDLTIPYPRSLGKTSTAPAPTFARKYKVWGKYPDKIMLCKLTWSGR